SRVAAACWRRSAWRETPRWRGPAWRSESLLLPEVGNEHPHQIFQRVARAADQAAGAVGRTAVAVGDLRDVGDLELDRDRVVAAVQDPRLLDAHPRLEADARVVDQRAHAAEADVDHRGLETERADAHLADQGDRRRHGPARVGTLVVGTQASALPTISATSLERPLASRIRSRAAFARARR